MKRVNGKVELVQYKNLTKDVRGSSLKRLKTILECPGISSGRDGTRISL